MKNQKFGITGRRCISGILSLLLALGTAGAVWAAEEAEAIEAISEAAAEAVSEAAVELLEGGSMEGTNVILPIVSSDLDELMESYIKPFENAGYHVKVKFCPAEPNEAAARVVMRELGGGQLISSNVAFGFGYGPQEVYEELSVMLNADGEPYGADAESEDLAA